MPRGSRNSKFCVLLGFPVVHQSVRVRAGRSALACLSRKEKKLPRRGKLMPRGSRNSKLRTLLRRLQYASARWILPGAQFAENLFRGDSSLKIQVQVAVKYVHSIA